jgi:hypothetical protein
MQAINKTVSVQPDFAIHSQQHHTSRQSNLMNSNIGGSKENKYQSLLAAVEHNKTSVVDQRRKQNSKDHYQSHREFGRDISSANNTHSLNAKIVNSSTN